MISLNNFEKCFKSLYTALGLDVKKFGNVLVAYSGSSVANFNLIFDIKQNDDFNHYKTSLEEALAYASKKTNPSLLIQCNNNYDNMLKSWIESFDITQLQQKVTCVFNTHKNQNINLDKNKYRVERVNTSDVMKTSCEILSEAFEIPITDINKLFFSPYFLNDNTTHPLFILYDNKLNEPIATSMLYLPPNKSAGAGHYAWATKKLYRNKGVMTCLVSATIDFIETQGYSYSVAQCNDNSIGVAKKLGFSIDNKINLSYLK